MVPAYPTLLLLLTCRAHQMLMVELSNGSLFLEMIQPHLNSINSEAMLITLFDDDGMHSCIMSKINVIDSLVQGLGRAYRDR